MSPIGEDETVYNSLLRLLERQDAFGGEVAAVADLDRGQHTPLSPNQGSLVVDAQDSGHVKSVVIFRFIWFSFHLVRHFFNV